MTQLRKVAAAGTAALALGGATLGLFGVNTSSAASPWVHDAQWCGVTGNPNYGSTAYYEAINMNSGNHHCFKDGTGPLKTN